jgi:hypothetical protein
MCGHDMVGLVGFVASMMTEDIRVFVRFCLGMSIFMSFSTATFRNTMLCRVGKNKHWWYICSKQ